MTPNSVSYLWKDPGAAREFASGVSLHSHTNQSRETLDFLANLGNEYRIIGRLIAKATRRCQQKYNLSVDFSKSYWTPPLTPRLAFDLESRQIERLNVMPLVSITDHDNINAPMLLRTVASARHIPVSVEWTVPFGGDQAFHLGIHNLPASQGAEWMRTFAELTAEFSGMDSNIRSATQPATGSEDRLTEILVELHKLPNVLIVFNHPMWDLYLIGADKARQRVHDFMTQNGEFIHALELNGLRNWEENRSVKHMAVEWNKLLISGGDRHGMEPNANINLTQATSFTEFVHEVRYQRRSHILFMPQYAEPWKHRILQSTLDAVRDHPDFPQGSRFWDERVFHPDANGVVRPVSELWAHGHAPFYLRWIIDAVRLMGSDPVSNGLKLAWNESHELRFVLGE